LARLVVEFSPPDGPEDGGKLFIQTNPLKQVHIIDTSVSKLSMAEGLILLHLLSGADENVIAVHSLRNVVSCGDGTNDEYHGESCYPLLAEHEPEPRLDGLDESIHFTRLEGLDESVRFTPLNNFFILHNTCNNNTQ
jgi:hypothetical protein